MEPLSVEENLSYAKGASFSGRDAKLRMDESRKWTKLRKDGGSRRDLLLLRESRIASRRSEKRRRRTCLPRPCQEQIFLAMDHPFDRPVLAKFLCALRTSRAWRYSIKMTRTDASGQKRKSEFLDGCRGVDE
ncbi:hypothetical protein HN011_004829 [Eciton burchellii]|nr:hypothetical protein HN011_004829 [Eciton burchellii]